MSFKRFLPPAPSLADPGQVRHALKTALAAVATWGITQLLGLEQGFWAVISVIIVMQSNIGSSLNAAKARLLGTVAGACLGAVSMMLFGTGPWALGLAVFSTILVCSWLTALHESFRLAGITAAIVISFGGHGASPIAVATDRSLEIGLGVVVALLVSFLFWPSRARAVLRHGLAAALEEVSKLLGRIVDSRLTGEYQRQPVFHHKEQALRLLTRNRQLHRLARREPGYGAADEPLAALSRFEERLYEHLLTMDHTIEDMPAGGFRLALPEELTALAAAIETGAAVLAEAVRVGGPPPPLPELTATLTAARAKLLELRREKALAVCDLDELMRFLSFYHALQEIGREVAGMAVRLTESLEEG